MRVDVFIHPAAVATTTTPATLSQDRKLDQILRLLNQITKQENRLMATLDETLADVQAESAVDDSLITLTTAIKAQLDALLKGALSPAQQAQVDAIFAAIEANKVKVAAAITANTPAA